MATSRRLSRRSLITGGAMAVAGASAAAVTFSNTAAGAPSPARVSGTSRIARVVSHSGAVAEVEVLSPSGSVLGVETAPVDGFPEGWQLRRGDRVILVAEPGSGSGWTIKPLVEPVRGRLERDGATTRVGGRTIVVRDGEGTVGADSVAFCIRNDVDGSLTAAAVRSA